MSFILSLGKKLTGNSGKNNNESNEETKTGSNSSGNLHPKKTNEVNLAQNKVNINTIYNKNEDYKPMQNMPNSKQSKTNAEKNLEKYKQLLEDEQIIDIDSLKKLAWNGVPKELRPMVWKILLKYMPINKEKRESTINRKREEYANFVQMYCTSVKDEDLDEGEKKIKKLIGDDVHRTQPDFPLFHEKTIQKMMIRILYVWHVRHPASGYVQGINDLLTPFLSAFFLDYIDVDYDTFLIPSDLSDKLGPEEMAKLEADTYWCLSKILDGILDNYTLSQIGTQKSLNRIKEITKKIDAELYDHLQSKEVEFTLFSLRWIFCLLVREFPLRVGMRLFDTYVSDEQGFSVLHIYVCAALLLKWSKKLKKMGFQDIMVFLQSMPTKDWSEKDIEMIVAEAYVFMTLYEDSKGHLANSSQFASSNGN